MRSTATFVCLLIGASVALLAQTSSDFARGADIRLEGPGTIFRAQLPEDVYDTITNADLADVRVFDAAGEVVPHSIREAPVPANAETGWRTVRAFPMTNITVQAAARAQVRIGAGGAVLEVVGNSTDKAVTSYLIDTSAFDVPTARLALTWDAAPAVTFLTRISVLGSNDLDTWHTIVPSVAIAQLRRDDYTLTQNEFDLPGTANVKYLRVSWPGELAGVTLRAVQVRPKPAESQPQISWRTLSADAVESGVASYVSRARLPIEYLDVEFADSTDAAFVTIKSRSDSSNDWVTRHSALFYALNDTDSSLRSPSARIARTADTYWRIETTRAGGWSGGRAPRLKIGWRPHELLFLARGRAPYLLAYGSARTGTTDTPVGMVLAALKDDEQASQIGVATIGPSRSLGGADVLQPATPWRQVVMWVVLVGAVGALGFLAIRLFRDTATSD